MNVASLFSGVGGMDLGLHRAGHTITSQCEADEWRRSILAHHWPGVPTSSDVRALGIESAPRTPHDADQTEPRQASRLHTSAIPRADLVCGGFPCQDVSVAGRRAGLAGERTSLFHHATRIIDLVRPDWILLENVPGLLSSNGGRDFGVILGSLADLGYGVAWRILDARYFGVAQRRRRVFIVGRAGGVESAASALRTLVEGLPGDSPSSRCSWQNAPGAPASRVGSGGGVTNSLTRRMGKGTDSDANHLVANTLSSRTRMGHVEQTMIPGESGVRRLTPVECERLMSWPDNWTDPHGETSDARRYAACGDGVVSNAAEWIGRRILAEVAS